MGDVTPMRGIYESEAFRALDLDLGVVLGGKTAKSLKTLGLTTVRDLFAHLPRRYMSGLDATDLSTLRDGEEAAVLARISSVNTRGYGTKQRVEAVVSDGRGRLRLTFFSSKGFLIKHWATQLAVGQRGIFVGKVTSFQGQPQMTHPTFVVLDDAGNVTGRSDKTDMVKSLSASGSGLVGLYPASAAVPTWHIAQAVRTAIEQVLPFPDPFPAWVRGEQQLPDLAEAIVSAHLPMSREEPYPARDRLVFDEAFAVALAMAKRRRDAGVEPAVARPARADGLLAAFDAQLPFPLTDGQRDTSETILGEIAQPHPMYRLLQGEVGSGKTVVALRAMLSVVDAGGQAVLLAPTEVLAHQHLQTLRRLLGTLADGGTLGAPELATRIVAYTGSMPTPQKREARAALVSGEVAIAVGTHALLSPEVSFADLGMLVIDEQHRFGVEQRGRLAAGDGPRPHVLVLTATPIPRSIAQTVFGDLAMSALTEVPAGRAGVETVVVNLAANPAWEARIWQRVGEEVAAGRQAFVVAPRITDSGDGAMSVEGLEASLRGGALPGVRIGVLHGQLSTADKNEAMRAFAAGEVDVLIATTVIEVGIDVTNATVMVVMEADWFGVSQLHQLRGRIGRGSHPGLCLLVTRVAADTEAAGRLEAVASTSDGFALAEVDLAQRREGDVLGSAQSGLGSSLRLLRVTEHRDVIEQARVAADRALGEDPELATPGFADAVRYVERLAEDAAWEG